MNQQENTDTESSSNFWHHSVGTHITSSFSTKCTPDQS